MAAEHRTAELRSIELHRLIAERLDEAMVAGARERASLGWRPAGLFIPRTPGVGLSFFPGLCPRSRPR
jgi:hypothetical protein